MLFELTYLPIHTLVLVFCRLAFECRIIYKHDGETELNCEIINQNLLSSY